MEKTSVADVNRELKRLGRPERLRRGRGYYYFADGDAASWTSSSVYVAHVGQMTVDAWVRERDRLSQG